MSISKFLLAAAIMAVPMTAANSFAGIVTFSDLPADSESPVASNYQPAGLPAGITTTFSNFNQYNLLSEIIDDHTGDAANTYIWPETGSPATIEFAGGPVEVPSLWVNFDFGSDITVNGLLNGNQVWTSGPVTDENWVEVIAGAGISIDALSITGQYSRVDDITVNAVPEPATLGLVSIAGLGMLKRRR